MSTEAARVAAGVAVIPAIFISGYAANGMYADMQGSWIAEETPIDELATVIAFFGIATLLVRGVYSFVKGSN